MSVDVKPLGGSANETTTALHRRLFPNSFLEFTGRVRRRVKTADHSVELTPLKSNLCKYCRQVRQYKRQFSTQFGLDEDALRQEPSCFREY